jgi:hypothetical protein
LVKHTIHFFCTIGTRNAPSPFVGCSNARFSDRSLTTNSNVVAIHDDVVAPWTFGTRLAHDARLYDIAIDVSFFSTWRGSLIIINARA